MIDEVLIKTHVVTGKVKVSFFPDRVVYVADSRSYSDISGASRKRIEKVIRKHEIRIYVRERGISVWIRR